MEDMVLSMLRKHSALSEKTELEKRKEREREEKKRKERIELQKKVYYFRICESCHLVL